MTCLLRLYCSFCNSSQAVLRALNCSSNLVLVSAHYAVPSSEKVKIYPSAPPAGMCLFPEVVGCT
nr:MAG TPA: hypothetical protein [Bacteriophage sp.]